MRKILRRIAPTPTPAYAEPQLVRTRREASYTNTRRRNRDFISEEPVVLRENLAAAERPFAKTIPAAIYDQAAAKRLTLPRVNL